MTAGLAISQAVRAATLGFHDDTSRTVELRHRLSTARDLATTAIGRPAVHCDASLACYGLIVDVATAFIAARASEAELLTARRCCLLLLQTASVLDELGACDVI